MRKTFIRTKDVFDISNKYLNEKYFVYCRKKALEYGLECISYINESGIVTLELTGPKYRFVKYYLSTMLKTTNIFNGIKRLISIILT